MKTKIVQTENEVLISIPRAFIEKAGLAGEIEVIAGKGELILRSAKGPRENWEEAFRKMAAQGDGLLLDSGEAALPVAWDESEWTW